MLKGELIEPLITINCYDYLLVDIVIADTQSRQQMLDQD